MNNIVYINKIEEYNVDAIYRILPDSLFAVIKKADTVVLKPNWVKEAHLSKPEDWEYVITHPDIITAVLRKVLEKLGPSGKVIITDGPQTDSSFEKILAHYPVNEWNFMAKSKGVDLQIIDLREDEWINEGDVTVSRKKLVGDPKGSTEVNLVSDLSEFHNHVKSKRGYYGADYDLKEVNKAHDGNKNLYRVSRSIIEANVFINIPKLKTHKKAGITCCLKNLVGINTYKNYLPHHSEGGPEDLGDQFPANKIKTKIEGPVMAFIKQYIIQNTLMARIFKPLKQWSKNIFGDTNNTIRSGNWYGNDTVWRMILDLNKVLFYANYDGTVRDDTWINTKTYIGIVDAIRAGEGNGPMAPDPVQMNAVICGNNPVLIDTVCSKLMGFDFLKIPSIKNAYEIKKYKLTSYTADQIEIRNDDTSYAISELPEKFLMNVEPHFGWKNHIEFKNEL